MKRALVVVLVLAIAPVVASAELIVSAPNILVSDTIGTGSFDIVLSVVGSDYAIRGPELKFTLSGSGGVNFSGIAMPTANPLLQGDVYPDPIAPEVNQSHVIYCWYTLDASGAETKSAGTSYSVFTVNYTVTPGTVGVFDIIFDESWSGILDGSSHYYDSDTTYVSGTITVTPEPASLAMLAIGGVLLAARQRRRLAK